MLAGTAQAVDLRDWGRKFSADQRFAVLSQFNSQAVLDKETQLVWQRTPHTELVNFFAAQSICLGADTGGRLGWRLPTGSELRSLIDPAVTDLSVVGLPAGHPFIGLQPPGPDAYYWTSTRHATDDTTRRLATGLHRNVIGIWGTVSTSTLYVWCVRGPVASGE